MVLDYILVIAGFLLVILIMAFVLNPPEAWVKKAFLNRQKKQTVKDAKTQRHGDRK